MKKIENIVHDYICKFCVYSVKNKKMIRCFHAGYKDISDMKQEKGIDWCPGYVRKYTTR